MTTTRSDDSRATHTAAGISSAIWTTAFSRACSTSSFEKRPCHLRSVLKTAGPRCANSSSISSVDGSIAATSRASRSWPTASGFDNVIVSPAKSRRCSWIISARLNRTCVSENR